MGGVVPTRIKDSRSRWRARTIAIMKIFILQPCTSQHLSPLVALYKIHWQGDLTEGVAISE
jgi:hypothetical protein